jgi:triphosphoribosyl-dephospho-CoA synthase
MKTATLIKTGYSIADVIAGFAQEALLEEVYLTPKPGLVDLENNGSHHDLTLELMELSALILRSTFREMAVAATNKQPSQALREQLAAIGRLGEQQMLQATNNVNTHKGAIWCIGLLTAATSILVSSGRNFEREDLLKTACLIARFEDRFQPQKLTNGMRVSEKYAVISAREEAQLGFPTLAKTALPAWDKYNNVPEEIRKLNVLLSLIAVVDDTCILHRSDMEVLKSIQQKAKEIIDNNGMGQAGNHTLYYALNSLTNYKWVSPGGSADLLAATIFVHKVATHFNIN